MDRSTRRRFKNALLRVPPKARRPIIRGALRSYEHYLAVRAGTDDRREDNGLLLPPPKLRVLVSGAPDLDWFIRSGRHHTEYIRELLSAHGRPMDQLASILDFGCGCGRLLRWWRDLPGEIHGCDYNAELVDWCRQNLPFSRVITNELVPPLPYGDAQFDFVYALSVFTHLTEANALRWLTELTRIIRPNGFLWITVHGDSFRDRLVGEEQDRFAAGDIVVQFPELEGTNLNASYWPKEALERLVGSNLVITDRFDASDAAEAMRHELYHDAYLLQRTHTPGVE